MDQQMNPARAYALVVGTVLLLAGIVGFFYEASFSSDGTRSAVFGILDTNGWHNLVHIATGGLGLIMAKSAARSYALLLGVVYTAVAIWGFVLGDGKAILDIIPINTEDNVLHLALGLVGLLAYKASEDKPATV